MSHNFTALPGIFAQSEKITNPDFFDWKDPRVRFGLKASWSRLKQQVSELQQQHGKDNVKVLFLARHGQGVHNYVMAKYGRDWWEKQGMNHQYSNDEYTWGPDPELTELGVSQAREAHVAWKNQLESADPVPVPQSFYVSPFSRACDTLAITWGFPTKHISPKEEEKLHVIHDKSREHTVVIHPLLRETIGYNTCDKRRPIEYTLDRYSEYRMTEHYPTPPLGEDDLWTVEHRETNEEMQERLSGFLENLFETDKETYVSITCHAGVIRNMLGVLGHRRFFLQTGAMIPVVVVRSTSEASATN